MKQGDILKWVLIAGAAYLVYRYLSQSGLFSGFAQPAPVEPKPEPKQIAAPAEVVNPQKVTVTAESLLAYAKPNMPADWDQKMTISQWNWVVSKMTGTDQQTDLSFGESVPDPVTVQDYMSRRVRAGISGVETKLDFSHLAELLPVNSWSN